VASAFLVQRKLDEALASCDEAIRLGADPVDCAYQRWMCFMLRGDFASAWQETDRTEAARRRNPANNLPRHMRRVWNGTSLQNRRVLVRCYHGLGDTIQFARYIPIVKNIAASVVLQCQPTLVPLLASLVRRDEIALLDCDAEPSFDCEIELMELPYAFRTTLAGIPRQVPYLQVPQDAIANARTSCEAQGFKVGLCWSSGEWNPHRNIRLRELAALARIGNITLFSLQCGSATTEIEGSCDLMRFHARTDAPQTIVDTAATILQMDLVISVDTMVAHLAGALGKPVWTLLPFCADWRWMLGRRDSPWYPTMRLYRQKRPGEWGPVVREITSELAKTLVTAREHT
jgi:hypothetical protein